MHRDLDLSKSSQLIQHFESRCIPFFDHPKSSIQPGLLQAADVYLEGSVCHLDLVMETHELRIGLDEPVPQSEVAKCSPDSSVRELGRASSNDPVQDLVWPDQRHARVASGVGPVAEK